MGSEARVCVGEVSYRDPGGAVHFFTRPIWLPGLFVSKPLTIDLCIKIERGGFFCFLGRLKVILITHLYKISPLSRNSGMEIKHQRALVRL